MTDPDPMAELRLYGELLHAALHVEGVPRELASRIFNRFFFGNPDGVEMPFHHPPRAQVLVMDWPVAEQETAEKTFTPFPELPDAGRPLLYDPDGAMGPPAPPTGRAEQHNTGYRVWPNGRYWGWQCLECGHTTKDLIPAREQAEHSAESHVLGHTEDEDDDD